MSRARGWIGLLHVRKEVVVDMLRVCVLIAMTLITAGSQGQHVIMSCFSMKFV